MAHPWGCGVGMCWRRVGGLTAKIVALADALGNLVRFVLLPGHRHDSLAVAPLLAGHSFGASIGNNAFDTDALRSELESRGVADVIPPKSNRTTVISRDFAMYRWRDLIENLLCDLRQSRRVATRYDKTGESYSSFVDLAAIRKGLR